MLSVGFHQTCTSLSTPPRGSGKVNNHEPDGCGWCGCDENSTRSLMDVPPEEVSPEFGFSACLASLFLVGLSPCLKVTFVHSGVADCTCRENKKAVPPFLGQHLPSASPLLPPHGKASPGEKGERDRERKRSRGEKVDRRSCLTQVKSLMTVMLAE